MPMVINTKASSGRGQRYGKGVFVYGEKSRWKGNRYSGQWKNDRMHGSGAYTYANGNTYTGEWKEDNINGFGTMTYANGEKYTGEWGKR